MSGDWALAFSGLELLRAWPDSGSAGEHLRVAYTALFMDSVLPDLNLEAHEEKKTN